MLKSKWTLKTWGSFLWSVLIGIVVILTLHTITINNRRNHQDGTAPTYLVKNSFIRHTVNSLI
jgi:hypothetical protein